MKLHIVFEAEEGGWIHVWSPDLPGCHSQGRSIEEAEANIKEAIEGFLEDMAEEMIAAKREGSGDANGGASRVMKEDSVEARYVLAMVE